MICQNGESITVYGDFVAVVADEKTLKALHNMVGASACLCCIKRRNVIGRCEHFEHPYLVHVTTCYDESRFIARTEHDYNTAAAELHALRDVRMSQKAWAHEQRGRGFSYHPEGLPWGVYVGSIMKAPTSTYYDFQHCVLVSGGLGEFHVNRMCLELIRNGISLKHWTSGCPQPLHQ